MSNTGKFGDLITRLVSAVVLIIIGGCALAYSSVSFNILLAVCAMLMAWEVLRMHGAKRGTREIASAAMGISALTIMYLLSPMAMMSVVILVGLCVALVKKAQVTVALYLVAIIVATAALAHLRMMSVIPVLFLVACVIASDVGGYFAGRLFGGPKLWPAVSPKKTWSGTIGGWVLAALVAFAFIQAGAGTSALFIMAISLAMAAQLGDLAESWMKRRAGIKDASNLIPGHGGLLDRFDGVIGAAILAGLYTTVPW